MSAFILLLHVVGWGLLLFVVVPARYEVGAAGIYGVGLGVTAYTLGMRHAFDAGPHRSDRQHHPQADRRDGQAAR